MADVLNTGEGSAPKPTAVDFLGREAPVSFEGKAALPVGSPAVGVSSGQPTISGSGIAPPVEAPPTGGGPTFDPEQEALMREAEAFMRDSAGGGASDSAGAQGLGTGVSGIDANAISLGLAALSTALGIPGITSLAELAISGIPTTSPVAPAALAGLQGGKGLFGFLQGLLPENEVTIDTPQGPLTGIPTNTPTSTLGAIAQALSAAFGQGDLPSMTVGIPGLASGIPGLASPDDTISVGYDIGPAAGYTDPSQTVGVSPAPGSSVAADNAPATGPGGATGPGTGVSAGDGSGGPGAGAAAGGGDGSGGPGGESP